MKSHKALFIGLTIAILICIAAGVMYSVFVGPPKLILQPSPQAAEISIDDTILRSRTTTLTPGEHTIKVSAPDHVTYEKTITIRKAQQIVLPILLKPVPSPITLTTNIASPPKFIFKGSVYFLGNEGKTLYRTRENSGEATVRIEALTPDTLSGIQKVVWQPDAESAFLKRADGIYLYDFKRRDLLHQTDTLWGREIDDIAWSPNKISVAYTLYGSNGEQTLVMSDIQNKNIRREADLSKEKIDRPLLAWSPHGRQLLLISTSAQKKSNYMYTYDTFSRKITQLTLAGEVEGGLWSPAKDTTTDSEYIAYAAPGQADGANTLWVAKADGSGVIPLNVAVSSISKVSWATDGQSLIVSTGQGGAEQLVNVTLKGEKTPFVYNKPATFTPDHLLSVPGNERVLFLNGTQFMSLALVTAKYE